LRTFRYPHGRARSRAGRRGMQKFRRECRWACADPFLEQGRQA